MRPTPSGWHVWPRSLPSQLALLVALVLFTVHLIISSLEIRDHVEEVHRSLDSQARTQASNLAAAAVHFALTRDLSNLEEIALRFARLSSVREILVTDISGRVLTRILVDDGGSAHAVYEPGARLATPDSHGPLHRHVEERLGVSDLLAGSPGIHETWQRMGEEAGVGWVVLRYGNDDLIKAARKVVREEFSFAVAVLLVTWLVIWGFLRRTVRELNRLTDFAGMLQSRRGESMPPCRGSAELEVLSEELNLASRLLAEQEQALVESRKRLEDLINSIDGIFWEFDPATDRFTFVSRRAETLLGYAVEDWYQPGFWHAHLHPEDHDQAVGYVASNLAALRSYQFEYRFLARDGRVVWLNDIATVLHEGGHPRLLRGLMVDVTGRKQVEIALQENELKFRTMADFTSDWEYWIGPDHHFVYISPSCAQVSGYEAHEFLSDPLLIERIVHEEDAARYHRHQEDNHRERQHSPEVEELEFRIVRKSGDVRWISHACRPVYGPDGALLGRRASNRDITEKKLAVAEIERLSEQNQLILDSAGDGILGLDIDGNTMFANEAACQMLGFDETELVGRHQHELIHHTRADGMPYPPEECRIYRLMSECRDCEDPADCHDQACRVDDEVFWRKDGGSFPVEYLVMPMRERGRMIGAVITFRDISSRLATEEELRLAASLYQATSEGILITDAHMQILAVNSAYTAISGFTAQEMIGRSWEDSFQSQRALQEKLEEIRGSLYESGHWKGEVMQRRKNGEIYPCWMNISAMRDSRGQIRRHVAILSDISQRKEAEDRIRYLAHYDALTGLPNRALMQDRLVVALSHARRNEKLVAVMFVDLDRFKHINDTLGHDVGDLLLQAVARRLSGCVRETDTVARLGGDEFIVILHDITDMADAGRVGEKILQSVGMPVEINAHHLHISPSVGIAVYPFHGSDIQTLMKNADIAMYHAKEHGRNNYQFYQVEMNTREFQRLQMENSLRRGLMRHEFQLYYQPQMDFGTGCIVGVEALLRWNRPDKGLSLPLEFMTMAEETGQIVTIGEWVLQTACEQNRAWQDAGLPPLRMAVNFSPRQFRQHNLVEMVRRTLDKSGLDPQWLEFELTENVVLQDEKGMIGVLAELRKLGVCVSLDDFGKGYSSLTHLKHYPVYKLKIGQEFTDQIPLSPDDSAIVKAVIELGHSFHLKVIAEAVEREEQARMLRELGCDEIQGHYFCRPLSAADCTMFLKNHSA